MTILDVDQISQMLHDRRLDVVAEATKLHRNTIAGIRDGRIKNPSIDTAKRLSSYLHQAIGAGKYDE